MEDNIIEGDVVEPEPEPYVPGPDDPFSAFLFPTQPFGELLIHIRQRIGQSLGRDVTQEEFGELLGHVNQVTISRWQLGKQKPQEDQLKKIVALAHQHGLMGLTLARLQQSLNMDISRYAAIDPRVERLNTLLLTENEAFKTEFFEVVIGLYHLLKGVVRSRDR
jgi:transcriptional regulator with XRE-family HTH domain